MATIAYNTRPRPTGIYVDGKKRNFFVRFIMRLLPWKGDSKFEMGRKCVFLIALTALIYFGGSEAYIFLNDHYQQIKIDQKLEGIFNPNVSDEMRNEVNRGRQLPMLDEYIEHWSYNNDLVGHILIPDMTSSLPYSDLNRHVMNYLVYQRVEYNDSGSRRIGDNEYYLNHNFDGARSAGGSIFADYRHGFEDDGVLPGNTVLYGHNIYTGNMFAKVADYYKAYYYGHGISYYQKHPIVHFNTLYERHDWKIFAVVLFNTDERYGEVYNYHVVHEFTDADHFHTYILDIMDRSVIFTDVDLEYGDHILTLSTCFWPQTEAERAVVFARRVRDGESLFVDVEKAHINRQFLPYELQARSYGSNWVGRVWDYETYLLSYDGD
ncbi:MAG: class B sortase [Oscillospiraceae bacterium]|nr:class B sortase [Oscillospiraceae bacterium]